MRFYLRIGTQKEARPMAAHRASMTHWNARRLN